MTPPRPAGPELPRSLLVISQSLGGGGAERMVVTLLRHLDRRQFRPSLAVFAATGPFLKEIPADVPLFDLRERSPYDVLRTAARLASTIRAARPVVILSALKHPNLLTLAVSGAFFRGVPVVISEQNQLSITVKRGRSRRLKEVLHRRLYPRARRILAVSTGVKRDLEQRFGIPATRIEVIHNPCEVDRIQRCARDEPGLRVDWSIPTVVAAGRLTGQKGFGYLLEAVAVVARRRPVQLLILGEGEDRAALTRRARALQIADRVMMPGFQANPFACMARGRVFVLSSLWEGFPSVIVEAMACGTPVVSTACPSGPTEIITDGVNGLLVPVADVRALAEAIDRLLLDQPLAKRLCDGGLERAPVFSAENVVRRYEAVLEEAASS